MCSLINPSFHSQYIFFLSSNTLFGINSFNELQASPKIYRRWIRLLVWDERKNQWATALSPYNLTRKLNWRFNSGCTWLLGCYHMWRQNTRKLGNWARSICSKHGKKVDSTELFKRKVIKKGNIFFYDVIYWVALIYPNNNMPRTRHHKRKPPKMESISTTFLLIFTSHHPKSPPPNSLRIGLILYLCKIN